MNLNRQACPIEVSASTSTLSPDDLRELMQRFTHTSSQLQATHEALQEQVARLQGELAEANAALRRSHALAALGEMAAGIAHEVRNPLGSIQLYVQMLAEDLVDRPAQAALCEKIDRAVVGLDAIVRDVLSFARDTTVRPELTSTSELMGRALSTCEPMVLEARVAVAWEPQTDYPLCADAGLLIQALANVIRNAIEAMTEGGAAYPRLRLGAQRRRVRSAGGRQVTRIVFSVQDNGPGIAADVLDRIFNPFFTTRKTGTGLGLAIVHRIIDAHGGHVNILNVPHESRESGGARVELYLPSKPTSNSISATGGQASNPQSEHAA